MNGQDEPILRCDWLPERARWRYLARSGLPAVSRKKHFLENLIWNPLLTKLDPSRWLDALLVCFRRVYGPGLLVCLIKTGEKHLINIQPPCPNARSMTHIYHVWLFLLILITLLVFFLDMCRADKMSCWSPTDLLSHGIEYLC